MKTSYMQGCITWKDYHDNSWTTEAITSSETYLNVAILSLKTFCIVIIYKKRPKANLTRWGLADVYLVYSLDGHLRLILMIRAINHAPSHALFIFLLIFGQNKKKNFHCFRFYGETWSLRDKTTEQNNMNYTSSRVKIVLSQTSRFGDTKEDT